jgi:hypothetical protein
MRDEMAGRDGRNQDSIVSQVRVSFIARLRLCVG